MEHQQKCAIKYSIFTSEKSDLLIDLPSMQYIDIIVIRN
jgi:hypothetical protein